MTSLTSVALASLALAAPLAPLQDAPRRSPAAGSTWQSAFSANTELEGRDLTVEMNGQPVPAMFLPELEYTVDVQQRVVVVDTAERAVDGRVSVWLRRFEALEQEEEGTVTLTQGDGGPQESESSRSGSSPLLDRAVRLVAGEDGQWSASWADEGGQDGDLLAGLTPGPSLAAWAFPEEVDAKDWTLSGDALAQLVNPGGDLGWRWEGDLEGEAVGHAFEGELELSLKGPADAQRRTVAIGGQVTWTRTTKTDLAQVPVADGTATQSDVLELELEGELVWDGAAGRLASLELSAPCTGLSTIEKDPGQGEGTYKSTTTLDGRLAWKVQAASVDE